MRYEDIISARVCPYCGRTPVLADSAEAYNGRSFGPIWLCRPCRAFVGCHKGTTTPKGRLADAALREAKKAAHHAFDPLWQEGLMRRTDAYASLSKALGIPREYTHIGMFNIAQCQETIRVCTELKQTLTKR